MSDLEASKLKKLVVKKGDFELHLEKDGESHGPISAPAPHRYVVTDPLPEESSGHKGSHHKKQEEGTYVKSPMVGTFYASPSPDQPPFVKVGDLVTENSVVCIIEAMKVMNEVKAGVKGVIAEVLIDNAQPVEFGAKLFRIR
jgi:acetyl-CoA carboxylase biotin carboxyl carrier protein